MNIFFLHKDPRIAADYLCDRHAVKMILESAQMMSFCCHMQGNTTNQNILSEHIYKLSKSHKNHPCTLWANATLGNRNWLFEHAFKMCLNYCNHTKKVHKSENVLTTAFKYSMTEDQIHEVWYAYRKKSPETKKSLTLTYPPLCIPDKYKRGDDKPVESYRYAYAFDKMNDKTGEWMLHYKRAFSTVKYNKKQSIVFHYNGWDLNQLTKNAVTSSWFTDHAYTLMPAFIVHEWCKEYSGGFAAIPNTKPFETKFMLPLVEKVMDACDATKPVWIAFDKS